MTGEVCSIVVLTEPVVKGGREGVSHTYIILLNFMLYKLCRIKIESLILFVKLISAHSKISYTFFVQIVLARRVPDNVW